MWSLIWWCQFVLRIGWREKSVMYWGMSKLWDSWYMYSLWGWLLCDQWSHLSWLWFELQDLWWGNINRLFNMLQQVHPWQRGMYNLFRYKLPDMFSQELLHQLSNWLLRSISWWRCDSSVYSMFLELRWLYFEYILWWMWVRSCVVYRSSKMCGMFIGLFFLWFWRHHHLLSL